MALWLSHTIYVRSDTKFSLGYCSPFR